MKISYLLLFLLIFSTHSHANEKSFVVTEVTEVTSVYDGDTFRVNIDGWPQIIGERMPIRVKGIDTPELRSKCDSEKQLARQAKQYTVTLLRGARNIELRNLERGKYFRLLADVFIDGESLGAKLLRSGHARNYDGGKRKSWC